MDSQRTDNQDEDQSIDMDIHVQFPSNDHSDPQSEECEAIFNNYVGGSTKKEREILVVLLGWAGAEHKYLSKYSDFYLKRGCITLRYITPLRFHFMATTKLPILAHRIVKFIKDLKLDDHPVFFHVFSNGGSNTYSYILRELNNHKNSVSLDIRGTIFDSAPCPRRLLTSYNALISIFSNLKIFRFAAAAFVIFLLVCQVFWYHIKAATTFCIYGDSLDNLENRDLEVAPLTNWLGRIANLRNHHFLFLYSDEDELMPVEKIERFANIVENRGNKVDRKKFNGSGHVMHFRRFPKEYGNSVTQFIRSAMTDSHVKTMFEDE